MGFGWRMGSFLVSNGRVSSEGTTSIWNALNWQESTGHWPPSFPICLLCSRHIIAFWLAQSNSASCRSSPLCLLLLWAHAGCRHAQELAFPEHQSAATNLPSALPTSLPLLLLVVAVLLVLLLLLFSFHFPLLLFAQHPKVQAANSVQPKQHFRTVRPNLQSPLAMPAFTALAGTECRSWILDAHFQIGFLPGWRLDSDGNCCWWRRAGRGGRHEQGELQFHLVERRWTTACFLLLK